MAGTADPRSVQETRTTPDPSVLTTQQSMERAAAERDYTDGQIAVLAERMLRLVQRMDDRDEATKVLHETVTRVPTDMQFAVGHLAAVVEEKFNSVTTRFALNDDRQKAEAVANETKVNAAFAAQKEASCLSADTPVLCADLTWRPAGDLLVGDELIAFDEFTPPGLYTRCYRRSVVLGNDLFREPLLTVNTPLGSVRCTYEHPWLVRRYRGHSWEWRKAEDLRPGDVVMKMLDVWEVDRSWDAGWLAGILDGEGCLGFKSQQNGSAKISVGQVDGPTADRIDVALKATGVSVNTHTRLAKDAAGLSGRTYHAQAQRRWEVGRRSDVMKLLGSIRPPRLLANSDQVWEGFTLKSSISDRRVMITSIEGAGSGLIAQLSTSTKTYIGAGFAMHNSEQNKSNQLAINKSEDATKEAINKLGELVNTTLNALSDKLDDIKDRVVRTEDRITRIETTRVAAIETKAESRDTSRFGLQVIAGLIGVVLFAIAILEVVAIVKK